MYTTRQLAEVLCAPVPNVVPTAMLGFGSLSEYLGIGVNYLHLVAGIAFEKSVKPSLSLSAISFNQKSALRHWSLQDSLPATLSRSRILSRRKRIISNRLCSGWVCVCVLLVIDETIGVVLREMAHREERVRDVEEVCFSSYFNDD